MATAIDIAHVVYEAPDLDVMERFLIDFGLTRVARTGDTLYMRGAGSQHYLHVTRLAEQPRFVGAAFEMASRADLEELAVLPGSSPVTECTGPGGGWMVRTTMADGFAIDAIWGREAAPAQPLRAPNALNDRTSKPRVNASTRVRREPCEAIRLGHFVLHVSSHDESVRWMSERFGLLHSDYFAAGEGGPVYGTFLRFNRGETLVDHHSLLVLQSDAVGVHHCSFEVNDLDAVMGAHDYLVAQGYQLDCGVGRHLMGSQIFDYWKDPFGFRVEHYTDGDVVDASFRPGVFTGTAGETTQWGMEPPPEFFQ
ncbi:VOC family protein [Cupriavidus basilensis]|uniref:VOC family protein n=1 Tax=Cupriavidus basilensis TaxID=68895 RepID=UPI0020A622BD|nr:VOC family protein [Cupriavidus basilensis]MCP3024062.1 VOC family protein [Cupriavidus basilensis]